MKWCSIILVFFVDGIVEKGVKYIDCGNIVHPKKLNTYEWMIKTQTTALPNSQYKSVWKTAKKIVAIPSGRQSPKRAPLFEYPQGHKHGKWPKAIFYFQIFQILNLFILL